MAKITPKVRRIRRDTEIAKAKKKPEKEPTEEEKDDQKIIQQIDAEYNSAYLTHKNKLDEGLKRLKLFNNQKRDKDRVGDPLIFTIFNTVFAALYDDKLAVEFGGREEGDEDTADNLNGLAEFDYDEMEKSQHDHDWDWDSLAWGRGLSYFDYFDEETKTPISEVWDPLTFIRDPDAVSVNGNRLGNGAMRFGGREVLLTKETMEEAGDYENLNSLKNDTGTSLSSLYEEAKRQRREAQGFSDLFNRQEGEYRVLQWFTIIGGKKYMVELANDRKLIVRKREMGKRWPIIDRPCFPMAHDWDGVSIFDILEDKQRFRAALLNVYGDLARASLYPMRLYDETKIKKKQDLNFAFNKWIPVDGPVGDASQLLAHPQGSSAAQFILEFLDQSAQRALATPEIQQGQVSNEKRTATELNLVSSKVDTRYSLTAKIWGWSEKDFWKRWYEIYDRDYPEVGKKVARLMGAFGPQWRELTRDKIITNSPLGPDIKIESRILSEAKKQRTFQSIMVYAKSFIIGNPNADMVYLGRKAGHLLFPKDEVERMLPLTIDERQAKEENEHLNENEPQLVRREDNHIVHLRVHAGAKDNEASKIHIKAHEKALMIKRLQPELFPQMPPEMPMANEQGQTINKAPEGAMGGFVSVIATILIGAVIIAGGLIFGNEIINQKIQKGEVLKQIENNRFGSAQFAGSGLLGAATGSGKFPTSTNNFQDDDTIQAGDWNSLENWMGIRNSTDTLSINYRLKNNIVSSIVAGTNITVNNSTGTVTINSSGGGSATSSWSRNNASGYVYLTTSTDKVGIGTSTPQYNLDIQGDMRVSGTGSFTTVSSTNINAGNLNITFVATTTGTTNLSTTTITNLTVSKITYPDATTQTTNYKDFAVNVVNATTSATASTTIQKQFYQAITLVQLDCSTNGVDISIQGDIRASSTPNTLGTTIFSSTLTCPSTSTSTITFSNANVSALQLLNFTMTPTIVNSTTTLRIHGKYKNQ